VVEQGKVFRVHCTEEGKEDMELVQHPGWVRNPVLTDGVRVAQVRNWGGVLEAHAGENKR